MVKYDALKLPLGCSFYSINVKNVIILSYLFLLNRKKIHQRGVNGSVAKSLSKMIQLLAKLI